MAAKIGSGIKYKNKFYDADGHEIIPVQRGGKMLWYCETCALSHPSRDNTGYYKTWFVKRQVKIGGRE